MSTEQKEYTEQEQAAWRNGGSTVSMGMYTPGLTKREFFAALALQGLLANVETARDPEIVSQAAIMQADSLLLELERLK